MKTLCIIACLTVTVPAFAQHPPGEAVNDTIPRGQLITAAEYTVNSGSPVPIPVPVPVAELTYPLPSGIVPGDTVRVRVRSSTGTWSAKRTVILRPPFSPGSNTLTAGRYRINNGGWLPWPSLPSATIPLPDFHPGDTLKTQVLSTNGEWSAVRSLISTVPSPTSDNRLTKVEWQINSGAMHTIDISPPVSIDANRVIPLPPLTDGDTVCVWYTSWNGLTSAKRRLIYYPPYPASGLNITAGEWFIDTIMVPGSGHPLTIPIPGSVVGPLTFSDPELWNARAVFVRFKSNNGVWGPPRSLKLRPVFPIAGNAIIDGERFLSPDPGDSSGTHFAPPFGTSSITRTITLSRIPCDSVLFVRFRNENRAWGGPHPITTRRELALGSGWNLVSLGAFVPDPRAGSVFPHATSRPFWYDSLGYQASDTLESGKGYWLKFPGGSPVVGCGVRVLHDTIAVWRGWNLIGSISEAVDTGSIITVPVRIRVTPYYGYRNGYTSVTVLEPFRGYWVKVNQNGLLFFNSRTVALDRPPLAGDGNLELPAEELVLTDARGCRQTLLLRQPAASPDDTDLFDLPPPPPEGVFDARFSTGKMVARVGDTDSAVIRVTGIVYPLRITVEGGEEASGLFLASGGTSYPLGMRTPVLINRTNGELVLRRGAAIATPRAYRLAGNYPNPFNPATTIRYELPEAAHVCISVYDILGRRVAELVNGEQIAGYRSVQWDGTGSASGVYYCRMDAGGFSKTIKMLLLR